VSATESEAAESETIIQPSPEAIGEPANGDAPATEVTAKDGNTEDAEVAPQIVPDPLPQFTEGAADTEGETADSAAVAPTDIQIEAAPEAAQADATSALGAEPDDQATSSQADAAKTAPTQAAAAVATPTAAPQSSNTEASAADSAPAVQPRGAAPLPKQAQLQQAAQAANTAIAAEGDTSTPFEGDADSQPQKQNEALASQSKPQEAKSTSQAEIAKPAIPPVDAASAKGPPISLPEPVRALGASFNAASLQAANMNDRNPVALNASAIAVEIVSRMRDGMRRFDIRLDPPELGRIDVRLEVDRHGNVTTKLTLDRPETLDLMQRDARGLERALQQAGLKTDGGGLEFSLRSHADQNPAHDQSGRGLRSPDAQPGDESARIEVVIEGYRAAAFARGGVDIRI
jgi:chemotaxis protein MotD